MKLSSRPPLLPPKAVAAKLFFVGSTVGPLVDSLHNQCLLVYDIIPITLQPIFCSSWAVPPLLGLAYLILGYILPRVIDLLLLIDDSKIYNNDVDTDDDTKTQHVIAHEQRKRTTNTEELRNKAILAVTSTALIIKLSEFLQTHDCITLMDQRIILDSKTSLVIMILSDILQWIWLDQTPVALVAATITAIGGPLSELPFVANGFWHYIPQAADYLPLSGLDLPNNIIVEKLLGDGEGYRDLALSSITGPCYFAVTTDAIALSRYFYSCSGGGVDGNVVNGNEL